MTRWKVAGINFDHFHMGDNLRMAHEHPDVDLVALCDEKPERMQAAAREFGVPAERCYTDADVCLRETRPDLVILCPATAEHGLWVERVAPHGVHILMEKPFAASVAEADRMIAAMPSGKRLAINWPMRWMPPYVTTHRLIQSGRIGGVIEVHYYGGNRGPLYHGADKVEIDAETVAREKPHSWFYRREHGGGSLLDYLGYGTTMGSWFQNGREPLEVTCVVDEPEGLEVDEHAIVVARYAHGLSKLETRWGTFTDPWTHQPQPKCGFVIVGTEGTISAYDYDATIRVQTRDKPQGELVPAEPLSAPERNPVEYVLDRISRDEPIEGPLSVELSRLGQRIVDAAVRSAREKRTVSLNP
jgi:glucose-fructose oxidoreductase